MLFEEDKGEQCVDSIIYSKFMHSTRVHNVYLYRKREIMASFVACKPQACGRF